MKLNKYLVTLAALLSIAFASTKSQAWEERMERVDVPNSHLNFIWGQTVSLPLYEGWHYVSQVVVRGGTFGPEARIEVIANGAVRGTIFLNQPESENVVNIGETVRSLEFRHLGAGEARFHGLQVVQSVRGPERPDWRDSERSRYTPREEYGSSTQEGAQLARRAIVLVDKLRDYADPEGEYVLYLLPIKTVAGRAYGVAVSAGNLSDRTKEALLMLAKQIDYAEPVISSLMKRDATFEWATDLVTVRHRIEDRLH